MLSLLMLTHARTHTHRAALEVMPSYCQINAAHSEAWPLSDTQRPGVFPRYAINNILPMKMFLGRRLT